LLHHVYEIDYVNVYILETSGFGDMRSRYVVFEIMTVYVSNEWNYVSLNELNARVEHQFCSSYPYKEQHYALMSNQIYHMGQMGKLYVLSK